MDDKKSYDIDICYAEILEQNELINEHSTRYKPSQIKKNINNLYKLFNHNFILEKNILNKEINNILIFIFILTFTYDLLNIFHYDKNNIFFILLNINLICIKYIIIYNI